MGLSKLSAKCSTCPHVDKCDHKRMEALGFLPEPSLCETASMPISESAVQSSLRETIEIRINGKPMIVYRDDIEKQIYGHLHKELRHFMPAT